MYIFEFVYKNHINIPYPKIQLGKAYYIQHCQCNIFDSWGVKQKLELNNRVFQWLPYTINLEVIVMLTSNTFTFTHPELQIVARTQSMLAKTK